MLLSTRLKAYLPVVSEPLEGETINPFITNPAASAIVSAPSDCWAPVGIVHPL